MITILLPLIRMCLLAISRFTLVDAASNTAVLK